MFISFIEFCKHVILREAYVKEYRPPTGAKNQRAVGCSYHTPKGLLGPGYHLYGDYCVPNFGQRGKNIDSASVSVKPSFGRW